MQAKDLSEGSRWWHMQYKSLNPLPFSPVPKRPHSGWQSRHPLSRPFIITLTHDPITSFAVTTPMYMPSAYAFSRLQFYELSSPAQHYLANVARLVPPSYHPDPNVVKEKRSQLAVALYRSLQGVDMAMIGFFWRLALYGTSSTIPVVPVTRLFRSRMKSDYKKSSGSSSLSVRSIWMILCPNSTHQ